MRFELSDLLELERELEWEVIDEYHDCFIISDIFLDIAEPL